MFEGKKMGLGEGITPAPRNPKGGLFPHLDSLGE